MIRPFLFLVCTSSLVAASLQAAPAGDWHKPRTWAGAAVARANEAATVRPTGQGFVNGNQIYPYADGAIFQVFTAPEHVTDIALQSGEALRAVASGDTARWVIGDTISGSGAAKQAHVLVKPFAPDLRTNIVITTDRHTYHLSLLSTRGVAMSAISWTYPAEALLAVRGAETAKEAVQPVTGGLDLDRLNFGYAITGPQTPWRPLRAFDDGRQTFIEFPPSLATSEAPPLFLLDEAGQPQLVNYRLRGRYYVIDRLFDVAELRIGGKDALRVRIARDARRVGQPS